MKRRRFRCWNCRWTDRGCLWRAVSAIGEKARSTRQPLEIVGYRRKMRVGQRRAEPPVERQANRDIRERKISPCDECARRFELSVQYANMLRPIGGRCLNRFGILMNGRLSDEREESVAPRPVQFRGLPVDPLVDARTRLRIDGVKLCAAVSG